MHESAGVKLTKYPGTVRQLVVTGLGREAPTVIITNDYEITTRALVEQDRGLYLIAASSTSTAWPATPGEIINNGATITVKINRRAYSPVLRHADLPADTTVPWWDGRRLHFEFT